MALETLTVHATLVHVRDYLIGYPTPVVRSRASADGLWHFTMANGEVHTVEVEYPVHILRVIPPK